MAKLRKTQAAGRTPSRRAAVLFLASLLAVAVVLFAAIDQRARQSAGQQTVGGPFTLVDSTDRAVTDRDFRGHYMLVYFGYTDCPDICPTTLVAVMQALTRLGRGGDDIQPVFITVDPRRDTPRVIGRYVAAFSPRLIGLTGSQAQITAAEAAYHVLAKPGLISADGFEAIEHSAVLYLMSPSGTFIAPLPANTTAAALAVDLARFTGKS